MQTVLEHHKPFISTSVNQNKSSHHYTGYDDLYQPMTQLGKKNPGFLTPIAARIKASKDEAEILMNNVQCYVTASVLIL